MAIRHHVLNTFNVVIGHAEKASGRSPDGDPEILDPVVRRSESVAELVPSIGRIAETHAGEVVGKPVGVVSIFEEQIEPSRVPYPHAIFDTAAPGGAIYVRVRADSSSVTARIADDGPGIQSIERARSLAPPDTGASGFGLYLANAIGEPHGRSVSIRNGEPRGAVVEMTFRGSAASSERLAVESHRLEASPNDPLELTSTVSSRSSAVEAAGFDSRSVGRADTA